MGIFPEDSVDATLAQSSLQDRAHGFDGGDGYVGIAAIATSLAPQISGSIGTVPRKQLSPSAGRSML